MNVYRTAHEKGATEKPSCSRRKQGPLAVGAFKRPAWPPPSPLPATWVYPAASTVSLETDLDLISRINTG